MRERRSSTWIAATLVWLVGCGRGAGSGEHGHDEAAHGHDEAAHGHGEGHEHAEVAIGITRWSTGLELYAEHAPAVVGRPVEVLAHLTVLEGFRALEQATVSLELEGPRPIRARVAQALRPGIFKPVFTPEVAGHYRGRLLVQRASGTEVLEPIELDVYPSEAAARAAHPGGDDPPGRITFLKEQQWRVPFATEFAEERALAPMLDLTGTITTPPGGTAEVGAPVAGRLVPPREGLVLPGSMVARGQLLATVAPTPSAPEASAAAMLGLAEAQSRVAAAEAGFARAERLLADRAISQRELDDARRELEVARAALGAARQSRRVFAGASSGRGSGSYRLTAPIGGLVIEVLARPGQALEAGTTLFRIVDPDRLWIAARVPEEQAPRVRTDVDARFQILGVETWFPIDVSGTDASAEVVMLGRVVDPISRTVDLIYALARPDPRLRVGGAVRMHVPVGEPLRGIAVPRSALIDDDGRDVLYVQVEGEAFDERLVRTGVHAGDRVAVTEGLRAGERIVTAGANLVRLAARASSTPSHGHVH